MTISFSCLMTGCSPPSELQSGSCSPSEQPSLPSPHTHVVHSERSLLDCASFAYITGASDAHQSCSLPFHKTVPYGLYDVLLLSPSLSCVADMPDTYASRIRIMTHIAYTQ